ncbi:hypothetical protein H7I53_11365 [Mycolicibacterium pulveris]|uniref:DUF4386 domain-containing protein n=1 Tax=Mycolicibacterium pulveris TaxID=36813 RepID=A0A7I7UHL0_MYCPV|nr:hypothetical protein [Mycolicibacterium pulveris]MCV6980816.1 hypothetical protein [Mycolicibacterium pulveris]BBY80600.1 hypothetical protein MPUL_17580 [Mycolicibacterium pulveris]
MNTPVRHRLSTPRAAALAGVLFAVLFTTVMVLMRVAVPDGGDVRTRVAATLMPFAGIAFLWFIGVVRDGFGGFEDKFFSTVFIGSGLLFLAMMFAASATSMAAAHSNGTTAEFARELTLAFGNTYGLRMAAVFMITLATIWLKTNLMPRWLVVATYLAAVGILVASDISMWLVLAFPAWVLCVSVLLLTRAGVIDLDR